MILVFAPASTVNGNVAPTRVLSPGFMPGRITLDSANNRLFVVDASNGIQIYDNAGTLNGAVVANRSISGPATELLFPSGMVLDSAGRLLVSNCSVSFNGITVYANAASANGNPAPTAVITGPATQLSVCTDIALSPTGELFVGNQGTGGILVFNGSATGNAAPIRFISGDNTGIQVVSGFGNLRGIALDPTR